MRDKLKPREYFDVFILEDTERINKFEAKLLAGTVKADRVLPVKRKITQLKVGVLIAKYSRGDSIKSLQNEFELLIQSFSESWDLSAYEDNLMIASLAVLLNVSADCKKIISKVMMEADTYDFIIDYMLNETCSIEKYEKLSFPSSYQLLADCIQKRDENLIKEYLNGWYDDHSDSSWYNSHKSMKVNTYYGYWCFEAAAIVKKIGLSDDGFKDAQYYPYDMTHF